MSLDSHFTSVIPVTKTGGSAMATKIKDAPPMRRSGSTTKKNATKRALPKTASKRKLKVPAEQWALPVSMDVQGHLVSMRDTCAGKTAVLSLEQLSLDQQTELVAERIERQPKFELSMIGAGVMSKERAIAEVRAQTPVGRTLIEIELRMMARMMKRARQEQD